MAPTARLINTFYGPYHTEQAVRRADFSDYIPVPDTDTNINAVHPIPVSWLRDELLPRERDNVREHVVSLLGNPRRLSASFVEALNETLANLDTIREGNHPRPDANTSTQPRGNSSPRAVRFADMDEVTRGMQNLTTGVSRGLRPRAGSSRHVEGLSWSIDGEDHGTSPPLRGILRSNSRFGSGTSAPASSTRQPSPDRDALVAVEIHLDEVEMQIERGDHASSVLRRCRESIASARAHIARARGFSQVTRDDVEMARAMVESVSSVANSRTSASRPQTSTRRQVRTAPADAWNCFAQEAQLGLGQARLRDRAYAHGRIPLFRAEPAHPEIGDALLLPDDAVLRLAPNGRWLRYHSIYYPGDNVYLLEKASR